MSAAGYLINNRTYYHPFIESSIEGILDDFGSSLAFHRTLKDYEPTPLEYLPNLAQQLNLGSILVKNEELRFGKSALKILGVSYAINKSLENKSYRGICTATDGSHGRAVAWVAKRKGLSAVIFVPHHISKNRIKYIEKEGAKVIVSIGDYNEAINEASYYARKQNHLLIQDTVWRDQVEVPALITAGYYTQMHEIYAETDSLKNPGIDVIFIQAKVGSWPSAIVHFIRKFKQDHKVKIVCVEPYESDAIYESVKRDALATTRKSQGPIRGASNIGTPSSLAFEILKNGADAFEIVADNYTLDAIKYLNAPLPGDPYIASGESGSAGLAGLLAIMNNHSMLDLKHFLNLDKSSNVLLFNTETVTDPILFEQIMGAGSKTNT